MDRPDAADSAEELLTRREHLRMQRQAAHTAPARFRLRLGAVLVLLAVLVTWIAVSWFVARPAAQSMPEPPAFEESVENRPEERPTQSEWDDPESSDAPEMVVVHVAGAVQEPQVVHMEAGDRVIDAVEAAGGLRDDAAPEGANLAAPAADGDMIYVPTAEELESGQAPPAAEGTQDTGGSNGQVNLNSAEAGDLEQLPGIGPALAERIITYREANGGFTSLEELAAVSGIGPAVIESIADDVTW